MKKIFYVFSFICLLIAAVLFYERSTWPNPSIAMMNGSYLTEHFVNLSNMLPGVDIQRAPKHDDAITTVNIIASVIFLVTCLGLFFYARRKH